MSQNFHRIYKSEVQKNTDNLKYRYVNYKHVVIEDRINEPIVVVDNNRSGILTLKSPKSNTDVIYLEFFSMFDTAWSYAEQFQTYKGYPIYPGEEIVMQLEQFRFLAVRTINFYNEVHIITYFNE